MSYKKIVWVAVIFILGIFLYTNCMMLFLPEDNGVEFEPQGLKISTPEVISESSDVKKFLDLVISYGFYTIEMTVKHSDDEAIYGLPNSGYAFYNSSIAPIADGYENFDALAVMIEEAHNRAYLASLRFAKILLRRISDTLVTLYAIAL